MEDNKKTLILKIGDFFFRYRNRAFPLLILALFCFSVPSDKLFNSYMLEELKDLIGIFIGLAGLAVRATVIGFAYIKRGGLNKQVFADELVTSGIFQLCRNPLYLGNMLICLSIFLMHGDLLVIIFGVGIYFFIYHCIIATEEDYLLKKFGAQYVEYSAKTPRWIPVISRFRDATTDMEFNFKRVIIKDYTTIATTIIAMTLVELYENLASANTSSGITDKIIAILLIGVFVAGVRYLKKSKMLVE